MIEGVWARVCDRRSGSGRMCVNSDRVRGNSGRMCVSSGRRVR